MEEVEYSGQLLSLGARDLAESDRARRIRQRVLMGHTADDGLAQSAVYGTSSGVVSARLKQGPYAMQRDRPAVDGRIRPSRRRVTAYL